MVETTINIKFDEKQINDVVKKVIKALEKKEVTEIKLEEPKPKDKKLARLYMDGYESSRLNGTKIKLYYGYGFHTLDKEYATRFNLKDEFDIKKIKQLKEKGWKEEVFYK